MTGKVALKACARELLIAIFRAEGAEGSARQVEIDPDAHAAALEILTAALTRASGWEEERAELVKALREIAEGDFSEEWLPDLRMREIATDALSKALPSLGEGGGK